MRSISLKLHTSLCETATQLLADAQSCRGYAPRYSASQKGHLRQVLFAARHILLDCCGRLDDSRTGEDAISWMLQARAYLSVFPVPTL